MHYEPFGLFYHNRLLLAIKISQIIRAFPKDLLRFFAALRMTCPGDSWLSPGHVILSAAKNRWPTSA